MRIKMNSAIMAQKKAVAYIANGLSIDKVCEKTGISYTEAQQLGATNTWEVKSEPIVRSYFNPAKGRTSYATWLGVKACHKRSGMDTFTFQQRYAMG